jgi:hypothetical protein
MKRSLLSSIQYGLGLQVLLALMGAGAAEEVYVSTHGSDENPGTMEQPFRTISHAYAKRAKRGVTIVVMPGVYTDYRPRWGIYLGESGNDKAPIVVKSQVPGRAVIEGENKENRNQGFYVFGDYNLVDGFEVRNCPHGGFAIYGNGNRIINNEIHHNGTPASDSTDGRDGIYSEKDTRDNCYAANSIHDNGRAHSRLDHGLYLCGQNEMVINNVVFRNAGSGLQIAGYTTVRNMRVYNNVMAWNGTSGIILWMRLRGVEIENNILYHNALCGIWSYKAHGGGVRVSHNLCFGNGEGDYNFTHGGSDYKYDLEETITRDPGFVNGESAGFDARLREGSAAIGAGVNLCRVFGKDKTGEARPESERWDLGAFAFKPEKGEAEHKQPQN